MKDPELVLRQVLVAEIGVEGQERIERATARLACEGLALEVAERYARGAGFGGVVAVATNEAPPFDEVEVSLGSHAARDVLRGARAALGQVRAAIGAR